MRIQTSSKLFIATLACVGLAGCTTQDSDTPPLGPPDTCAQVPALAGCTQGSLSYACTSGRPDEGDPSLACDDGIAGVGSTDPAGRKTLFCCAPYGQWASACAPATDVPGCGAQSIGFQCTGEVTPDQADTSIACSGAIAGDAGALEYCCVPFDQSSSVCRCSTFDEDAGLCGTTTTGGAGVCAGGRIGFDCLPGHSPTEVNAGLSCEGADGGNAGTQCCSEP